MQVEVGDSLTISGKWFHPSDVIYIRWDSVDVVGTVTGEEWLNANIVGSTVADATGYFVANVTIPSASAGEHYLAVEDSETRVIVKIMVYQGSLLLSPSSGPGGVNVQFSGSGYPASTPVIISYLDPAFGTWTVCGSTTADSSGNIVFTTEIPDLRKALSNYDSYAESTPISFRTESNGLVYGFVDYYQIWRGLKKVGDCTANGLFGNGTDLSSVNETIAVRVEAGDIISISGYWFHSSDAIYIRWDGAAVVDTVTSDEWLSAVIIGSTIANATGYFETSITIPTADEGEHFLAVEDSETTVIIKIYLESSPSPSPSPSPEPTPEPTPTPSPTPSPSKPTPILDVSGKGTATSTGLKVEIKGKLSYNGAAISGESVLISYSVTGGKDWQSLTLVNTGSDGGFIVAWTPPVTGDYLIKATWEGNSAYNEVSTAINLALTPYTEENWFSVTSNSTISALAFNSATKELSFTVSGPDSTIGHVNVYIPKSLINDISDLNVKVDETEVTYSSESEGDTWLISFSYSHSEHKVTLDLSAASSNTDDAFGGSIIYVVIVAVVVAVAAVATLVFRRKRQHTPTKQQ